MKTAVLMLLLCFTFGAQAQPAGKPSTVEQSYAYLDAMFDDTSKYAFMVLPEDVATHRLHFSTGRWIRNHWLYKINNPLMRYFRDKGVENPDNISSIVLTAYHRHLNQKPVALDEQIKHALYLDSLLAESSKNPAPIPGELFSGITPDSLLLQYFPVGDTIAVGVAARYTRWFSSYATSIRGIAVVKAHQDDQLLVQLIGIKKTRRNYEIEEKIGDVYTIRPAYGNPLPPPGWSLRPQAPR